MNDEELRQRLSEWTMPLPGLEARDRAEHRALLAFAHRTGGATASRPGFWRWGWGIGVALAALVAMVAWREPVPHSGDTKVLAEVEALFPGRVDAVVERPGGGMDIRLTEAAAGSADQPLVIEFRKGADRVRVLSYSGRRVCLQSAGIDACFEPLVTGQGKIILAGEGVVSLPGQRAAFAGWKIEARALPGA